MLSPSIISDGAMLIFDAQIATVQNAGERMAVAFKRDMKPLAQEAVKTMAAEPPKWYGKRRWNSERQQRYVMAKLRREGNLPYQRTHRLASSWRSYLQADAKGGAFRLGSTSSHARYTQGDDAQLMHLDSGWPQLKPTTTELRPRAVERAVQTWYTVSNPQTATRTR